ncbi:hypothetical protein BGX23_008024 [Mortierella sp. AD031]|nr:hypothetical protein BGX23_008024 [Mortierella sp. AD031]
MSHYHNQAAAGYDEDDETDDYGYDRNGTYATHSTPQHGEKTVGMAMAHGRNKGAIPVKGRSGMLRKAFWTVAVLLVLVVVGVLAWYFTVYKKEGSSGSNSGPNGGYNADVDDGTAGQGNTIVAPNGTVIPNTVYKLKRVFYGMAYVPLNAQLPTCYNTQQSIDNELQPLVQATRRIRLYGTDCNALRTPSMPSTDSNSTCKSSAGSGSTRIRPPTPARLKNSILLFKCMAGPILSASQSANEVMFDQVEPLMKLMAQIAEVKQRVVEFGHPEIPVFTSDLEGANRPPLTNREDLAGFNLHPFFSGVSVEKAASWFWKYLKETATPNVQQGNASPIPLWITEVGWLTFPATSNTNASIPSIPNLQTFVNTWLCDANSKSLPYYYFEFFDTPWKIWAGAAVEGFWGLLTIDKKLKVELPDCLAN